MPAPIPNDTFEVHGHLLGAAAAWEAGRYFDAVLNVRCAADLACDQGVEERSIELYQAAAALSATLPQGPASSTRTREPRRPVELALGVRLGALAKLSLEIRLRVAVDVLGQLMDQGVEVALPRSATSRLRFENVRIDAGGRAHLVEIGSRSGAGMLLWEILAGRVAGTNNPPPLAGVVTDVPYAIDMIVTQTLNGDPACARIDQILRYIDAVAGGYIASHEDVRAACGISQFDEPTTPATLLPAPREDNEPPSGIRPSPAAAARQAVSAAVMQRLDAIHGADRTPIVYTSSIDPDMGPTAVTDMTPYLEAAGFLEPPPSTPEPAVATSSDALATAPEAPLGRPNARPRRARLWAVALGMTALTLLVLFLLWLG